MTKCSECENVFEQSARGARNKATCSKLCRGRRNARPRKENKIPIYKNCKYCSAVFEYSNKARYYCSDVCRIENDSAQSKIAWLEYKKTRPDFKEIICSMCEKPVILPSGFTQKIASHPTCKEERLRARQRAKHVRRRGYRQAMKRVTIEQLADACNWVCYICNDTVDPSLPYNHKLGATVDHVIPLSKGGNDEPENLKLAHWICNIKKSDKVDYAQPR